jgi:hypothetical protein
MVYKRFNNPMVILHAFRKSAFIFEILEANIIRMNLIRSKKTPWRLVRKRTIPTE